MTKKLTTLIGAALLACGAYAQSTLNIITGTNVVIATTNIGGTNINMQISAVPGSGGASAYGPGITNASGVPAAALDAGANVTLTTNGNRISIAAAAGTGAGSTNATDVGTNVVFKGDIQATNATVGSLTIVGTGTNVLNGEARVTGNLRVVETNYAKAVVADYFSGPSTGPGTLTVNGTISSLTNNTGYLTTSNGLTVGTTNVIGSIANLNGQSNQWALLTWANSISNLVQTKQNGDAAVSNLVSSGVTFPSSGIVSNAAQVKFSVTTKTVHSGAVTNFTLDVNQGRLVVFATNGLTITNFSGLEAGEGTIANYVDLTVVGCTSAVPLVTFPTLGGNSFGVHCWTNFGSPVVTYITNACRVRYGLEFIGTNMTIVNCQTF